MNLVDTIYNKVLLREGKRKIEDYLLEISVFSYNSSKQLAQTVTITKYFRKGERIFFN